MSAIVERRTPERVGNLDLARAPPTAFPDMKVQGTPFRTIWLDDTRRVVRIIDQRWLPHRFAIEEIATVAQMAAAIREMHVSGAWLIGAAAGFGMYLATLEADADFEE